MRISKGSDGIFCPIEKEAKIIQALLSFLESPESDEPGTRECGRDIAVTDRIRILRTGCVSFFIWLLVF